jgi:translation initiation factor 2B subunit (eIF-2B alpha/beta/delta family)
MSSPAIATVIMMMESLPSDMQEQVADHIREYVSDLQDEAQWQESFQKTQSSLVAAARRAKQEIAEGKAKAMNYNQL